MADINLPSTHLAAGDDSRAILAKILQRLNLSADADPITPSANVAVTNTPLPVEFDTTPLVEISGQAHVLVDNALLAVAVSNFPATYPATQSGAWSVSVLNFPTGFDVTNTPDVHVTNTPNVTVTNFPATQPVSGSVAVTNFPATQPVSGTVNVGNFPATQPVSGTVAVSNFPATQNVAVTNTPTVNPGLDKWDDGALNTVATDFLFEVAHDGLYREDAANKSAFIYRVLGRRGGFNSTSVLQDLAEFLSGTDLMPELTGAENLELVSSSTQDDNTPGGTGTRTVRIHYMTTGYVYAYVDYALNGTVAVPVAEKMLFVYLMEALTGGASEVSVGNIDLRIAGAGAVHERITAGGNRSLSARFMVPDNYKAYVMGWAAGAIGTTIDFRLRATMTTFQNALSTRYIFKSNMYLGSGQNTDRSMVYKKMPARTKMKVSCLPGATAGGNRADCEVVILLIQD